MRFYPTKIRQAFICFIFVSISLNLGCSKDSDLLLESVVDESTLSLEERENSTTQEQNTEEEPETEENTISEDAIVDELESRIISFSPTDDAHFQSGKGYNQNIIRLEEGRRTSYLMFDMSPIQAIDGSISKVTLQFTINSDDGNGNISVFKGKTSNWTEESLSDNNVPEIDVLIGSITKEYKIGTTEIIDLETSNLTPEIATLVLDHKNGNDLAFASKEHASKIGPKLVVTYEVPVGTEEIMVAEEEEEEETTGEETTEEETTEEETTGEETTEEETTGEETTEEETTGEETTEEETTGEETTEEEPTNEEPMAVADATPSSGGVPHEVSFTGSNSADDTKIVSYLWDFKDGSTSTDVNPNHTFTTSGIFKVTLTATDEKGLTNTDEVTITVNEKENEAPKAIVSATPVSGEAPLEVSFKGSASTDDDSISSYAWDFKDGSRTNIADFKYTYTEPGTYEAELTVKDENGLSDKAKVTITVNEPKNEAPAAVVTTNKTSGPAPLEIQFIGNQSTDDKKVTSYFWDFKDGKTATNSNPSHSFAEAGTYDVELTVKDVEGLSNKKTVKITVNAPTNNPPVAVVSANPKSGQAPLNVQFKGDTSTDDNGITSYYWDFKDGGTATNSNPSHSFTTPGTYKVELTVKDAGGKSSTKSIDIDVQAPDNTGGNAPPGFYVATNGKSSNNGKSPSSPWSLEHAFFTAKAGDVIYVKAGNYGKKVLKTRNAGSQGNLIKFIGYSKTPGDINSSNKSTFNYGESVDSNKMPLLKSSSGKNVAFTIHHRYIHLENFQISDYSTGISTIDNATNSIFKNIIVVNSGSQNSSSAYDGFGITIRGNNSVIENCFVEDAVAQGITLSNSDYSVVKNCKVYADNRTNPMDYYILLADGTNNARVETSHVQRARGLSHNGHGINIKDNGTNNTFKNCTALRTSFELTYYGVYNNTIDGGSIKGVDTKSNNWDARMVIVGGAHHNTIKNLTIENTWTAISLSTFDDRGGQDASLGNDNTFTNITVKNTNRILNIGGGKNYSAKAKRYKFQNSSFSDFEWVAVTYYGSESFEFSNSNFRNGNRFVKEFDGAYAPYSKFNVSWKNCTWQNVNFSPPK